MISGKRPGMLSDQERRRLGELEMQFETEDPRFAGKFQSIASHLRARLIVAVIVMIASVITGVTGLVLREVPLAIVGILAFGSGACIAAGWER
jgi:Protein of unknown function (DUF3040)